VQAEEGATPDRNEQGGAPGDLSTRKSHQNALQQGLFPDPQPARTRKHHDTAEEILGREGINPIHVTGAGQAEHVLKELLKTEQPLGLDTETARLPEFSEHPQSGLEPHLSRGLVLVYGCDDKVNLFATVRFGIAALSPIWRCRPWSRSSNPLPALVRLD